MRLQHTPHLKLKYILNAYGNQHWMSESILYKSELQFILSKLIFRHCSVPDQHLNIDCY